MTGEPHIDAGAVHGRQAAEWCVALAEGTSPTRIGCLFDAWIADGDNMRALDNAIRVWNAADLAADSPK